MIPPCPSTSGSTSHSETESVAPTRSGGGTVTVTTDKTASTLTSEKTVEPVTVRSTTVQRENVSTTYSPEAENNNSLMAVVATISGIGGLCLLFMAGVVTMRFKHRFRRTGVSIGMDIELRTGELQRLIRSGSDDEIYNNSHQRGLGGAVRTLLAESVM